MKREQKLTENPNHPKARLRRMARNAKRHSTDSTDRYELSLHVAYRLARTNLPASATFHRWVVATLHAVRFQRPQPELSIRIVGKTEGRSLNQMYRGRNYATNVLSFPVERLLEAQPALLGDLVICAPVVAREAAVQGKPLKSHYAHLTVHGVLHLLGFDHQKPRETKRMEDLECAILDSFAISNPYHID